MIDAHRHFWKYHSENYPWISDELAVLRADFLPDHNRNFDLKNGITGVIAVQARCSCEENDFLLSLATTEDLPTPIVGIVGWLDLCADNIDDEVAHYATQPLFKGVRHLVQDEPNPSEFWQRKDFSRGIRTLQRQGLAYDLLTVQQDLPAAIDFAKRHDQAPLILDHLGKPTGKAKDFSHWLKQIQTLATLPHTAIKLSGLPLILGANLSILTRYWRAAIECFGTNRCLWGSDWPVCTLTQSAYTVLSLWQRFIAIEQLSQNDGLQIENLTATRLYKLEVN
ncbi:MAG: amidohydrolase family protein [Ostreibacterium sp.]